jgi:peptidoglycan/xylan/chitin deacetylase (PgdA/CDA1 family)
MKWSSTILAASLGLAAAHGDSEGPHMPKFLGARKFLAELNRERAAGPALAEHIVAKSATNSERSHRHQRRQDGGTDGQCGGRHGSCASGYCCSAEGWCGKGTDYCEAPDCQISYGPGCDGNKKPAGADTSSVARPKLGSVAYGGAGIYDCVNDGDIAMTFDDGPYLYTNDLLDKLKSYGAKATFFITGNNIGKGMINDPSTPYPAILKRMANEGHQIASHTWSHQNASAITQQQFTNQMVWNEIAFNSVLGFFPTYMRPPYSICEKNCQTILSQLGYHAIYFDLDTEGYLHDDPTQIQTSKNIWDQAINKANSKKDSFLQIEHDIHYQTVYNLTDYVLTSLFSHGYKSVTVGECLGDPKANWYRNGPGGGTGTGTATSSTSSVTSRTSTAPTTGPTGALTVSTDGSCGNGVTCSGSRFGSCCSQYGFCGTSDDYCLPANGCQAGFGTCTGSGGQSTTTISTSTKTTKTTTSLPPTSTAKPPGGLTPSVSGQCGADVNQTCTGSKFGKCCNDDGQCASDTLSCLTLLGCQKKYGTCTA